MIEMFISDERLLHLALEKLSRNNEDNDGLDIATYYVVKKMTNEGKEIDADIVCKEIEGLLFDHVMTSMVNKGIIDCDFDPVEGTLYSLTEAGKKLAEKIEKQQLEQDIAHSISDQRDNEATNCG